MDFRPAKNVTHAKKDTLANFKYIEEGPVKKKTYRDEEGAVLIAPRNFLTNPMKKGLINGKRG